MTTRIFGLLFFALVLLPWPAFSAQAPASKAPAAAAGQGAVSVEELQRLVSTLQDDKARARLIGQLQALIAAQRGQQPKQQADSPMAVLAGLSAQLDAISAEILAAASVVVDAPRLVGWFEWQASDSEARARWLERGLKLGIIFGAALLAEWLARLLLRRPGARLAARAGGSLVAQLLLMLAQLVVCALPVLVFTGVAYLIVPLMTEPIFPTGRVSEVIIDACLWARLILVVAQIALLSPGATALYTLGDETRNYLYIWVRRFTNWAIYGSAVGAGSWWLGVPGAIYVLILRGTMLVLGILSIVFVLQNRGVVADIIRGRPQEEDEPAQGRGWRLLRQRIGDTWHVLAIIYLIATFGSYVIHIDGGFAFVFRATVVSLVVLAAAGIIVRAVRRLSQRGFAIGDDLKVRFPTLEARANRYLPVLTIVVSVIVYSFAALALLQAWGVDAFAWFDTAVGRKLTGSLLSIATVLVVALALWELFGSAIERYLNGVGVNGQKVARSARARTLLPLLRTAVLIVLMTVVALIVLSEIGVDIAPLLAGAGVIGLAIGFGSQALVKDVITGLFILLEDTLAVGEVVDVGGNHQGVVEAISIRAIKLRDVSGTIHTVPFSEVQTVRNMTRDYSYFVADVGVVFRQDPDQVIAVLREVAEELREDPAYGFAIVEPLEVFGVEKFTDSAMVIRVRLKTLPLKQWPVGREFNRRMKKAFDQHGIEMPASNQGRYLESAAAPTLPPATAKAAASA